MRIRSVMEEFVEYFKALGDITRLKILRLLMKAETNLCVCEIMDAIEDSHYNVSRHLKILKTAKLVKEKKDGKWVYFGLSNPQNPFHEGLLQAVRNIPEDQLFHHAKRLMLRLSLRENDKCVDGLNSEKWRQAVEIFNIVNKNVKKSARHGGSVNNRP